MNKKPRGQRKRSSSSSKHKEYRRWCCVYAWHDGTRNFSHTGGSSDRPLSVGQSHEWPADFEVFQKKLEHVPLLVPRAHMLPDRSTNKPGICSACQLLAMESWRASPLGKEAVCSEITAYGWLYKDEAFVRQHHAEHGLATFPTPPLAWQQPAPADAAGALTGGPVPQPQQHFTAPAAAPPQQQPRDQPNAQQHQPDPRPHDDGPHDDADFDWEPGSPGGSSSSGAGGSPPADAADGDDDGMAVDVPGDAPGDAGVAAAAQRGAFYAGWCDSRGCSGELLLWLMLAEEIFGGLRSGMQQVQPRYVPPLLAGSSKALLRPGGLRLLAAAFNQATQRFDPTGSHDGLLQLISSGNNLVKLQGAHLYNIHRSLLAEAQAAFGAGLRSALLSLG